QFSKQIWAAHASGAVQQSLGPEAVLAGGVVAAFRLSAAGFGLGTGFDAAGQYWQHGNVRPEQSLVAGITGAGAIASVTSLPTALRFYGVPAAGAGVAGTNTTFNNFFYGEDTNIWAAGGLGAVFGAVGPRVGARVESELTQIITNAPRIPITGSATVPLQSRLHNVPRHVGSTVSHTVSNLPSFIPLDNGRQPLGSQP
uniref:hypothetical protein n=1 Tax=Serpentinimonas barnesii TaxID=1458427 RepID=UPI0005EE6A78